MPELKQSGVGVRPPDGQKALSKQQMIPDGLLSAGGRILTPCWHSPCWDYLHRYPDRSQFCLSAVQILSPSAIGSNRICTNFELAAPSSVNFLQSQ